MHQNWGCSIVWQGVHLAALLESQEGCSWHQVLGDKCEQRPAGRYPDVLAMLTAAVNVSCLVDSLQLQPLPVSDLNFVATVSAFRFDLGTLRTAAVREAPGPHILNCF